MIVHAVRCDQCRKEATLSVTYPSISLATQQYQFVAANGWPATAKVSASEPNYSPPSDWHQIDGKHFCSYSCLAAYALAKSPGAKAIADRQAAEVARARGNIYTGRTHDPNWDDLDAPPRPMPSGDDPADEMIAAFNRRTVRPIGPETTQFRDLEDATLALDASERHGD